MSKSDLNDADERPIFFDVSDEALERAGDACDGGVPTLLGTYCFTCPLGQETRLTEKQDIGVTVASLLATRTCRQYGSISIRNKEGWT